MSFQLRKRVKPVQRLVSQLTMSSDQLFQACEWFELQLPMVVQADAQYAAARMSNYRRARAQVDVVLLALQTHCRYVDRAAISGITLTRISSGKLDAHDNLRQAFKHVLDGVCVWICCGSEDFNRRSIGQYDDKLIGTGRIQCHYDQLTHETDRRLQGIRIRLHLGQSPRPQP